MEKRKTLEKRLQEAIEKIRAMPNRDDKLYAKVGAKAISVGVLDGGGVSRFEVIALLEGLLK